MSRSRLRRLAATAVLTLTATACGAGTTEQAAPLPPARTSPSAGATSATAAATPSATASRRPVRGVDVSHHQGQIDWDRVRRDGIEFAYLKATEGSSFVDPRFVTNAREAAGAGLRVGGYHYFTLCSPGAPQAEHFATTLAAAGEKLRMPPVVDLELIGNCADPPPREDLVAQVRGFLDVVEARTGRRVVVYTHPDLEARFRFASVLDRRQWVRRIGSTPPDREWWMWQRDDAASVDGISGPVDLNVLAP